MRYLRIRKKVENIILSKSYPPYESRKIFRLVENFDEIQAALSQK